MPTAEKGYTPQCWCAVAPAAAADVCSIFGEFATQGRPNIESGGCGEVGAHTEGAYRSISDPTLNLGGGGGRGSQRGGKRGGPPHVFATAGSDARALPAKQTLGGQGPILNVCTRPKQSAVFCRSGHLPKRASAEASLYEENNSPSIAPQ